MTKCGKDPESLKVSLPAQQFSFDLKANSTGFYLKKEKSQRSAILKLKRQQLSSNAEVEKKPNLYPSKSQSSTKYLI